MIATTLPRGFTFLMCLLLCWTGTAEYAHCQQSADGKSLKKCKDDADDEPVELTEAQRMQLLSLILITDPDDLNKKSGGSGTNQIVNNNGSGSGINNNGSGTCTNNPGGATIAGGPSPSPSSPEPTSLVLCVIGSGIVLASKLLSRRRVMFRM